MKYIVSKIGLADAWDPEWYLKLEIDHFVKSVAATKILTQVFLRITSILLIIRS